MEKVGILKYIGTIITEGNQIPAENKARIYNANVCLLSMDKIMTRKISRNLKIQFYSTIVQSVLLYGYESWMLTKANKKSCKCLKTKC